MSVTVFRPDQRIIHIGWPGAVRLWYRSPLAVPWSPALPTTSGGVSPEHWYRSDGPLWKDAGVTPASSDGDVVGRWEDKTANADHVNQAVVANKPTLQSGVGDLLNGHEVIRFNTNLLPNASGLQGPFTTGGALTQPFTIFAIAQLGASELNDNVANVIVDGDDVANRALIYKTDTPLPDEWAIYAGTRLDGGVPDANWHVWTAVFNGASSQFWHDGISKGSGAAGANVLDGLTIGASYNINYPWGGDIAEVIIYDSNLSTADKNQAGNYLATRYGLSWTNIV